MMENSGFQFPERLLPTHILQMLESGTLDIGALLSYGAMILVLVLLARRILRKTFATACVLAAVLIALALVVVLGNWPDRVPPLYFNLSSGQVNPVMEFATVPPTDGIEEAR